MNTRRWIRGLLLACSLAMATSAGAASHLLVEGVLKDSQGKLLDGTFDLTFALYAQDAGGVAEYTETHLGAKVEGGLFQERLGVTKALEATVFAKNASLWLGVTLSGQPELPRTPLETNPYAYRSLTSALANGLSCTSCVDATQLASSYAASATPGGAATSALTATTAKGLDCTNCVTLAAIGAGVLDASNVTFDDTKAKLGVATVQTALEKLKSLLDAVGSAPGAGALNEGNGTIVPYVDQWGLPSYGVATEYLHLMNPAKPKVVMWMYGGLNSGFSSSNNLIVTNNYTPNSYWSGVNGTAGQDSIQVQGPSGLNPGDNVLIHQTVGTGGNGTGAGTWEVNVIKAVQATSVTLAKPIAKSFVSDASGPARAQLVKAVSYNQLEVVNGGNIYPSMIFDGSKGGIVFVRAQAITIKSGGQIHANGSGHYGANSWGSNPTYAGASECNGGLNQLGQSSNNCSGGGGAAYTGNCNTSQNKGGGGGGNKTAGSDGAGGYGKGGSSKGDASGNLLGFGGGGGVGYANYGGNGGGLVVLGGKTVIVESGAKVTSNGQDGVSSNGVACYYAGGGAGAGGSVAIFAETVVNGGVIEAIGGKGMTGFGGNGNGGDGGLGWTYQLTPIAGLVNQSYATGVEINIDGVNVTPSIGDPNGKGSPHYDAIKKKWGATGTDPWSTGPLDLTNVANWTLGEHKIEFKETGGAGGDLKAYVYVIYPFTASKPPTNDTCTAPQVLDPNGQAVVVSGTTEDTMGKTLAKDDNQQAGCGGVGGPDVVYQITLSQRALLSAALTAPFSSKLYVRKADCAAGELVYCADKALTTNPLEAGTYYLFVDSDSASAKGDFTLAVSTTPAPLPSNDTCASAQKLVFSGAGKAVVQGTSLYALDQTKGLCPSALTGGPDVVFEFDAGTGQTLTANLTAGFSNIMYVTTSACGAAGVPLSCSATGSLTIQGLAGGKYWLIVDGEKEKSWGTFDLTVDLK